MTILDALKEASGALLDAGVPDSRLDAELLLAHVLGTNRMALLMNGSRLLSPAEEAVYGALVHRRKQREPLQYILACQSFMGFDLYVDENVLIPRPETELLCEHAITWLKQRKLPSPRILDLCTGSGALAVAIAAMMPNAKFSAADISEKALEVAKRNAAQHKADIAFHQGDFLGAVPGMRFDLIVCNPPYIPTAICNTLQAEVLQEPRAALDGGMDGLFFYRKLALEAPPHLSPGGALFCEVGYGQAEDVQSLFAPCFEKTDVLNDLSRIPRIVTALLPNSLPGGNNVRQV